MVALHHPTITVSASLLQLHPLQSSGQHGVVFTECWHYLLKSGGSLMCGVVGSNQVVWQYSVCGSTLCVVRLRSQTIP